MLTKPFLGVLGLVQIAGFLKHKQLPVLLYPKCHYIENAIFHSPTDTVSEGQRQLVNHQTLSAS